MAGADSNQVFGAAVAAQAGQPRLLRIMTSNHATTVSAG